MKTECPHCGQHYEVDDEYIGQVVECTTCGKDFTVKASSDNAVIQPQNNCEKMKALVCEMCGSTDLIKQNGLFVCQSCGIKYSREEARKMMIDGTVNVAGTVKVNRSNDVETMKKRIAVLLHQREWDEAKSCCNRALEIDPENADLYLFLCMIDHKLPDENALFKAQFILDDKNLQLALRLASPKTQKRLQPIIDRQVAQQKQREINRQRWEKEALHRNQIAKAQAYTVLIGCGSILALTVISIILGLAGCLD